jgi:hypothetical protein
VGRFESGDEGQGTTGGLPRRHPWTARP